ncbi:MAG: peptide ABC transporter substrate-binding protein [Bdellovibrionaceae bacterium]|nr:peptide ABC transporter substrate-binding protein [Pseudobdellovibrionaceae bacterium]|tara:strand:+ start:48700 stop:50412 length:1713 start_codon:yes stop_codon:yes gene_type:complete
MSINLAIGLVISFPIAQTRCDYRYLQRVEAPLFTKIFLSSLISVFSFSTALAVIGNPNAPVGGTVYFDLGGEPATLNPYTSTDGYSQIIHAYVFDTMTTRNPDTYEVEPNLAEKFEISKDGLSFTFYLRKDAKFHDGKPISTEDVKFSYESIMNPDYKAIVLRPFYTFITDVIVHDSHKITFKVKEKYFKNIDFIGGMPILEKSKYGNPKKSMNKKLYGSGPYILDQWQKGRKIILKRNDKWWGFKLDSNKGLYNYKKIVYRFVRENNVKVEMLKKGTLDFLAMRPIAFEKLAVGEAWGKKVFKVKAENKAARGYGFVGWNLNSPKLNDSKVREALSLLLDRNFIVDKFLYNLYEPITGPWNQHSMYADSSVKADSFDPQKALKLFREAGWKDSDKNGVLDKMINGKKVDMSLTIITAADETLKILTTYKEEAKKVGVDIDLKLVEWQTLKKLRSERKYEGMALAWGGIVHLDPHQIFHSDNAVAGGSNFVDYKNKEVDKLIDKARGIMSNKERAPLLKKVFKQIAMDRPYLFMFTPKYSLYGHTKRMKKVKDSLTYSVGSEYWWVEKEK